MDNWERYIPSRMSPQPGCRQVRENNIHVQQLYPEMYSDSNNDNHSDRLLYQ